MKVILRPLCIYHANCADGFAAAWVVREFFGRDNIDFYAADYQTPPPDVSGRDVIIVDFSYKLKTLIEMSASARSILVIDHHKTAQEDLKVLPAVEEKDRWKGYYQEVLKSQRLNESVEGENPMNIAVLFDMNRSGAGLAWDFFHKDLRPGLINHIEDRDLWNFKFEGTREIQAAAYSYPFEFDVWDDLMHRTHLQTLRDEGAAIVRSHKKNMNQVINKTKRKMRIGGHEVLVCNAPKDMASDIGNHLAQSSVFGASYFDTADGREFSLRSADGGCDVSLIAKQYGGGGHFHAAGFKVPLGWEGDEFMNLLEGNRHEKI